MRRLVLDTNVWLDWLVFGDPSVAPLKSAVAGRRARIFISRFCSEELGRGRRSLPFRIVTPDAAA